jgi:hypothetical protein
MSPNYARKAADTGQWRSVFGGLVVGTKSSNIKPVDMPDTGNKKRELPQKPDLRPLRRPRTMRLPASMALPTGRD